MAQHGGYRKPSNPAPVSGPGALSQRTDGQPIRDLPNAQYGEGKAFREIQQGAPTASAPSVTPPPGGAGLDMSGVVPMDAPTAMPEEPITAGADAGAGPGRSALGLSAPVKEDLAHLQKALPALLAAAQRDDASPSLKRYVRLLFAQS